MTELATESEWGLVPAAAQTELERADSSSELVQAVGTLKEIVGFSLLALLHLGGSILALVLQGFSVERLLWLFIGLVTAGWIAWLFVQRARRKTYFLLPSGVARADRNGVKFISRERVDNLFTREYSNAREEAPGDRGPAVELLLDNGEWVPLDISREETDRVVEWFESESGRS